MTSALPLNIGVTGHRDIPETDKPALEAAVVKEFKALKRCYPNTTINILTGLAQGADQLVARAALHNQLNVIAVLPFDQASYEKDFEDALALSEFRELLRQCVEVKVCSVEDHTPRQQAYTELGRTLVSCSDIVYALWDGDIELESDTGTSNALPGGTADVVSMCVEGVMDENSLLFSKPNQTYCKWLVTSREMHHSLPSSIASQEEIGTWKSLPIEGNQDDAILQDILNKIEGFNKAAKSISQQDKDTSVAYLLGKADAKKDYSDLSKLIDTYSLADCLAQSRQKQRSLSLKVVTFLSFFAIAAQQVYAGLYATLGWFVAHILLVGVVIGIYRLFFAGINSKELQFVEWRVFAENLRVQIFWHIAGITEHCANHYRTTKLNEMDWIVDNLNKLTFTVKAPRTSDLNFVKTHWVADQLGYFYGQKDKQGRASELLAKSNKFKKYSMLLFLLALTSMAFCTIKIELKLLPMVNDDALFLFIACLFVASALFRTYSEQMGYEELSLRYLRTGYFFQQAINRMALLDKQKASGQMHPIAKYQKIIKVIGVEALNENAAWLQLHKMNAYQVRLN